MSTRFSELVGRAREGDRRASEELLPLVYEELRALAEARLRREPGGGGPTLQPTLLVHEAYLRLLGSSGDGREAKWDGEAHFFGAAAIAIRRILIERARRARRIRHGGLCEREELDDPCVTEVTMDGTNHDLVRLDDALGRLEAADPRKGEIVTLRYFAGLTIEQTAQVLGVSEVTVKRDWVFAKAWLLRELRGAGAGAG